MATSMHTNSAAAEALTQAEGRLVETAAGLRLWVEEAGDGPPLLLVPELGAGTWLWAGVRARLSDRFRLVMPELRGDGVRPWGLRAPGRLHRGRPGRRPCGNEGRQAQAACAKG